MTVSSDPTRLEAVLRDIFPVDSLSTEVAAYVIDGLTPSLAVSPRTVEEVGMVLRTADEAGAAVAPFGGGTQTGFGMPLTRYDLALDLRALDSVVEYEPADLTVTVQAGMRFTELQRLLGANGQWLPIDPPLPEGATIGGILATNASGPARLRYGTLRDLLIGIRFVLPTGQVVKAGGRVVKNVAGYDLGKLHIGALGTLGVVVEATFKLTPLPVRMTHLETTSPDLEALLATSRYLRDAGLAVNGLVLSRERMAVAWRLLVRLAGGDAAVDRSRRDLEAFGVSKGLVFGEGDLQTHPSTSSGRTEKEDSTADATNAARPEALEGRAGDKGSRTANPVRPELVEGRDQSALPTAITARCSVVPSIIALLLDALVSKHADVVAYPTAGMVYASWPTNRVSGDDLRSLRRLCVEAGQGALVLEAAPIELKRAFDVWGEPTPAFELMRRVKQEMDPNSTLNPGRFLGGI